MKILPTLLVASALTCLCPVASAETGDGIEGSFSDTYAKTQTQRAATSTMKIVRSNTAAPRITRTSPYKATSYSGDAPASAPVKETSAVRVFRGGTPSSTRPCAFHSPGTKVTTYTTCEVASADTELAGGYTAGPMPSARDLVPVVGVRTGTCAREIRQLANQPGENSRFEVCYSDLQPVYGRSVERLYNRIERAARQACAGSTSLSGFSTQGDCQKLAVDMAVYDTGLQPLVNYHLAQTGGRPRVVLGPLRRY